MTKEEAKEILKEIHSLYPLFNREKDPETARTWIEYLLPGDYQLTKRKLKQYAYESTYPPTPAHIIVKRYEPPKNILAEEIQKAKEAVRKEREDPEKRKQHDALYQQLKRKLEGVDDFD